MKKLYIYTMKVRKKDRRFFLVRKKSPAFASESLRYKKRNVNANKHQATESFNKLLLDPKKHAKLKKKIAYNLAR